ncbi:MAG: carbon-nitrogen hydrolase family protein [Chloroflexota bacterium]|nr:carbon-nitrogen hydrolase family protein [Chloroflexota bacterium]
MPGNQEFPRFTAAAVQAGPIVRDAPEWFDLKGPLDKAVSLITEASKEGARLIVFSETWLPCYPYFCLDLADRRGFNEIWAQLLWNSIEVPGPEVEVLCRAAKKANAYVVMGLNERDKVYPGRMYNSILYLGPRGEIIGMHRKICITVQERLFHTPGDGGDNLKAVFDTGIGKLGGSICGEHTQYPLLYNWLMQGIQVHCSLWPGKAGIENYVDIATRSLCRIGHTFGILSATYMPEEAKPKKFYSNCAFNSPKSLRGGSGIVNPEGEYIAGPVYDQETIVYGDIDLAECDRTRFANNTTGYYARWDLLNLNVNQATYQPLVPMEAKVASPAPESEQVKGLEARIKQLEEQIAALTRKKKATEEK